MTPNRPRVGRCTGGRPRGGARLYPRRWPGAFRTWKLSHVKSLNAAARRHRKAAGPATGRGCGGPSTYSDVSYVDLVPNDACGYDKGADHPRDCQASIG
jgi:hypothetical protein